MLALRVVAVAVLKALSRTPGPRLPQQMPQEMPQQMPLAMAAAAIIGLDTVPL